MPEVAVSPADVLRAAYPDSFTPVSAQTWVTARRALLVERAGSTADPQRSASSGCAVSGSRDHAQGLAADAAHALARLDAGLGTTCERCAARLPLERLDSAPAAVRCMTCARAYAVDTRWCR